jgi:hypothetical protein
VIDERIVIEVNSDADLPENLFDGVVRTLKYPSGMEMTVGTPRRLDCLRESDDELEARLQREEQEYLEYRECREAIEGVETVDPLESWLS